MGRKINFTFEECYGISRCGGDMKDSRVSNNYGCSTARSLHIDFTKKTNSPMYITIGNLIIISTKEVIINMSKI